MPPSPAPAPSGSRRDAARAASEVVELLEMLWERGRDTVTAPPVSPSQLRVLHQLDREPDTNLRTLGDALGASPSSVSRLCDRLQAMDFVQRSPSPASRRELLIHLTPRGHAYLEELRTRREEALLEVVESMTAGARTALAKGLRGFRHAAEASRPVRLVEAAESTGAPSH